MLKGGAKFREEMAAGGESKVAAHGPAAENPAMWAWNMMANAGKNGMDAANAATRKTAKARARKKP